MHRTPLSCPSLSPARVAFLFFSQSRSPLSKSYQFWDQSISRILTSQLLRYNTNTSPLDYFNSLLTVLWISTLASLEFILSTVFRAIISNGKSDQLTTLFKTFNGLLRKSRSSYKSLQRPLWSDDQPSSLSLCQVPLLPHSSSTICFLTKAFLASHQEIKKFGEFNVRYWGIIAIFNPWIFLYF